MNELIQTVELYPGSFSLISILVFEGEFQFGDQSHVKS